MHHNPTYQCATLVVHSGSGTGPESCMTLISKFHKNDVRSERGSYLCAVERVQARRDASAGYDRGPIEHGEARCPRARLGGVQRARGEQVVVRGVDGRHRRVVLRREAADVRRVFDAAVDGEADGAVEFVVQHLVAV
jgi:hypothetical protein